MKLIHFIFIISITIISASCKDFDISGKEAKKLCYSDSFFCHDRTKWKRNAEIIQTKRLYHLHFILQTQTLSLRYELLKPLSERGESAIESALDKGLPKDKFERAKLDIPSLILAVEKNSDYRICKDTDNMNQLKSLSEQAIKGNASQIDFLCSSLQEDRRRKNKN